MTIHYKYTHTATEATTGFFSCEPNPQPTVKEALAYLSGHPYDDFMRRHILRRLCAFPQDTLDGLMREMLTESPSPAVQALMDELVMLGCLSSAQETFCRSKKEVEQATSLIFLRSRSIPDRDLQRRWGAVFTANQRDHRALQAPDAIGLPPLYSRTTRGEQPKDHKYYADEFTVTLQEMYSEHLASNGGQMLQQSSRASAAETAALAQERLAGCGIIAGQEMRHTASLSPIGLLRPWNMRMRVANRRHDFTVDGQATTYGRGFALADARASCLMEMVERASVYLSCTQYEVENRATNTPLVHGTRSQIMQQHGKEALDPNDYPVETPYDDAPLTWVEGWSNGPGSVARPVFVPLQMAGLFSNLDEISLFDAPGSTGIATGITREDAKLAALLEVIERDAQATTPFSKGTCFTLEADESVDPDIAALLADYKARGINIQFQDLTGPLGVPVYKCFVMNMKGIVAAGFGASLSARKALLSALTETPYPYPEGDRSGPLLRKLPVKTLHEFPEFTLHSSTANLVMLEELLERNGRAPVYMDLTRQDLLFPVVRCFIPGMELTADRDEFSRIPTRLYSNYLELFNPGYSSAGY